MPVLSNIFVQIIIALYLNVTYLGDSSYVQFTNVMDKIGNYKGFVLKIRGDKEEDY